jgi:hypothetical protein
MVRTFRLVVFLVVSAIMMPLAQVYRWAATARWECDEEEEVARPVRWRGRWARSIVAVVLLQGSSRICLRSK